MTDLAILAAPLLRATARARSLHEAPFVIKLGGSAMEDPAATEGTLDSIAALYQLGLKLILVHGGGKPIDRAMAEAGIKPVKVQGRRVTDDETLKLVVDVLGKIAEDLVAKLESRGVPALAMSDVELMPIGAKRLSIDGADLGHVGSPTAVDIDRVVGTMDSGMVPIIPSMALDDEQNWLNVNADTVASAVAGAIQAESAYFLTDTPGVLKDRNDPASLVTRLTVGECQQLIAAGVIEGGMIPKVAACFEAVGSGANRAVILDGRNPYSLLSEFISDVVSGTEILP